MNSKIKKLSALILLCSLLCGCEVNANSINNDLKINAEKFESYREFTLINTRNNEILYEIEGYFSRENAIDNQIIIVEKVDGDLYKRHIFYLNKDTIYIIRDVNGSVVKENSKDDR